MHGEEDTDYEDTKFEDTYFKDNHCGDIYDIIKAVLFNDISKRH